MRLAAVAGRFALFIAGMAVLTFISLFVAGAFLASWPILRVSPRNRKLTSLMGLSVAVMAVARAYGLDKFTEPPGDDTEAPEATEDEPSTPYGVMATQSAADFLNWARENRGSYLTDTGTLTLSDVETLMREYTERG